MLGSSRYTNLFLYQRIRHYLLEFRQEKLLIILVLKVYEVDGAAFYCDSFNFGP